MKAVPIGRALVRAGLISVDQAAEAVDAQRSEGGLIGQHLILAGAITRQAMYGVLAKQWKAPMIDLVADPPDRTLLTGEPHENLTRGWVPWRRDGDIVVIATSVPPTGERLLNMRAATGATTVLLRTATDWDVFQAVSRARRDELTDTVELEPLPPVPLAPSPSDRLVQSLAVPGAVAAVVLTGLLVSPAWTLLGLLVTANVVFVAGIVFLLAARWRAHGARAELAAAGDRSTGLDLPVYTVLVPSGVDAEAPETLLTHLAGLDYPKAKLEVMVLVDEDDAARFEAVKRLQAPSYVKILRVPRSSASSDSATCNYGLAFARGSFVVVYRAGDRPDLGQLRGSVATFAQVPAPDRRRRRDEPLVCVQATVTYANADLNALTRISAVELAAWYVDVLPAVDAWGLAAPLGATSQHYDAKLLRSLGAWDPDEETDGADLALRMAAAGCRVEVMSSTTSVSARDDLRGWVQERSHWISGCLLTTVARRAPGQRRSPARAVARGALLMANPLAFLAFPLAVMIGVMTAVVTSVEGVRLPPALVVAEVVWLVAGAFVVMALAGATAGRAYGWRIGAWAVASPVSWTLQAWAAMVALGRLAVRPLRA